MQSTMVQSVFDAHTIWFVFLVSTVFFYLACEVGFRIGRQRRNKASEIESTSTGIVTGSTLGMVSFLLAFTFSIAATNHSERRGVVLDEANAIGTAYLRADLLPPEVSAELKTLLKEYTEIRVAVARENFTIQDYFSTIRASEGIHNQMWPLVAQTARRAPSAANALVVAAVNDVIDLHAIRVAVGVRHTIPDTIWIALYFVSGLALAATGYRFGASFGKRSELLPGMVLSFACIVSLISDLDNPRHGFLLNDQSPMQELLASMAG
ncbi:MAG: hypothetical protein ABJG04_02875 [Roseobacter sp.]